MFKNLLSKKNNSLSYLTIAMGLTFLAVHADDYQNQNYQSQNPPYSPSDSSNDSSDQKLAKKIRDKIGSRWFSKGYNQVKVSVTNGNVTLRGYVKTQDDIEKVEMEVRNMDGVKRLISELNVQQKGEQQQYLHDTFATRSDDELNKKIRDKVTRGWLWNSYKDVYLNTSNGDVTLEGNVDSINDQQKLMKEIQKIDGVNDVNSNLRIRKS